MPKISALSAATTLTGAETFPIVQGGATVKATIAQLRAPVILAQSGVAVPLTGTTAETTLATITIPAGLMGANGSLRITPLVSYPNTANLKTLRTKLGATTFNSTTATTTAASQSIVIIRNRGALNSQVGFAGSAGNGPTSALVGTAAIDTSVDQNVTITGQLANTGETMILEGYTVEVLPA